MNKYICDEKNGLWYELQGDYYLLCLKLPKEESRHIGIWGQRHLRYLKQHRKVLYYSRRKGTSYLYFFEKMVLMTESLFHHQHQKV